MNDVITIAEVKDKVSIAEQDIAAIIYKLQEETTINVKAIMLQVSHLEVARNDDTRFKIEYNL